MDGCALEKGRLSLCLINEYRNTYFLRNSKPLYQVHCDDAKVKHSELYKDASKAVEKFLELKRKVK
jgi:hypothetical protein